MLQRGAISVFVLWLAGCGSHGKNAHDLASATGAVGQPNAERILNRGLPAEPETLDPQLADDTGSFQVIRDLYEGLTAENRAGKVVPGAAMAWTIDPTGTIYTFQLRPGLKWSDGTPVTAGEFVAGIRRGVDPKTGSGLADTLSIVKHAGDVLAGRHPVEDLAVSAIGDSVVRIELEHPAPFILEILSQPIAAPVQSATHGSIFAKVPGDKRVATNGAYRLLNRVPGSVIELERNDDYWDAAHVPIKRVRYVNAESEATELRKYLAGELDLTFSIPMQDLQRISAQYPLEVQTAPILGTFYLALNLAAAPLKDSVGLRQALSMAIDRDLIAGQVMMGVTPAYSLVAKGTSGYALPEYDWSRWGREKRLAYAKTLLARAGYSNARPLRLRLYYNRDEGIQRLMVAIAGNWRQNLGVEAELSSEEFRVFLAGRKDRTRWDVARLGWNADYDDPASFLDVFTRDNAQNDSGYLSEAFNNSMDSAKNEADPVTRMQLLGRSERILLDDYPLIPVYFYKARRLVKPYVGGAEMTPMNRTYSKHLFWKPV